ncbi:MAG: hypothetical protein IPK78_18150 [Rhodospirillales bacterium]|nr:hypothetical protein [Rhodospirillales bacterium]
MHEWRNGRALLLLVVVVMVVVSGAGPLARVMAGETPGCPFEAKVALAHVWENRLEAGIDGGWFGDAEPGYDDWLAVLWWRWWPDVTNGALYFVGPGDAARMPWLRVRTGRWECPGTWVESWW